MQLYKRPIQSTRAANWRGSERDDGDDDSLVGETISVFFYCLIFAKDFFVIAPKWPERLENISNSSVGTKATSLHMPLPFIFRECICQSELWQTSAVRAENYSET